MSRVEITVEPWGSPTGPVFRSSPRFPRANPAALAAMFDELESALAVAGLQPAAVVRNRLLAATRSERDTASALRFRRLAGPARCATSSYIDETRFAGGGGVRMDTIALRDTAATKVVIEHDPLQPPCRLVASGDLSFQSSLTSPEPDLHVLVQRIRLRLADTLALARERLGRRARQAARPGGRR